MMNRQAPQSCRHAKQGSDGGLPIEPHCDEVIRACGSVWSVERAPAVPSENVGREGASTMRPTATQRRMTSLAAGWQPTM